MYSEVFIKSEKNSNENPFEEPDDDDNLRNQKIEERSTVSEIVNKINNWSVSNFSQDWEKNKRRPVVSVNEMEKELTKDSNQMRNETNSTIQKKSPTYGKEVNRSDKMSYTKSQLERDLANNNLANFDEANLDMVVEKNETFKSKRIKGSLKSQDRVTKIPLGRKVSFDPLALLLDASLEGELELVKKTSIEVCL